MLVAYDTETNHVTDTTSATSVIAMRQATKNILYTVVNSRAYDPEKLDTGMLGWQKAAVAIDVVLAIIVIALAAVAIKKFRKRTAEEEADEIII
jgi:beta-glucosidase